METKLGQLIVHLADKVTHLSISKERNAFGFLWKIKLSKLTRSKVFSVTQAFTDEQLEQIQDATVLGDALLEALANSIRAG